MSFVAKNASLLSKILFYKAKTAVKPHKKEKYRAKISTYRRRMLETFSHEEITRGYHKISSQPGGKLLALPSESRAEGRHKARVLIIGRLREGDSIAVHTTAFLKSMDASAMDVHLFNEYDGTLYAVRGEREYEALCPCPIAELDASAYDIMLFLTVLNHGRERFEDNVPRRKALISYAYAVFDGTVPPAGWVNAVNAYFDALLVPVDGLKDIFVRHGVVKPVFTLPVLLELDEYFACEKSTQGTFTFGWIGAAEDRKNVIKILSAFKKAFAETDGVRLRLHTRFIDERTEEGRHFASIMGRQPSHVTITHSCLPEKDLVALMKSFDAYVYVSKGEGYSVTPRCALACGHPVILSAIHAHRHICDLGEESGVYWVEARKEVPAIQPSLNGQICGSMFDIEEADLVEAFRSMFRHRKALLQKELAEKRQKAVEKYGKGTVSFLYRQVLMPDAVLPAEDDSIGSHGIRTTDLSLIEKYRIYVKRIRFSITICPGHDGGFCSMFNKYMSHVVYSRENELVLPDWQYNTIAADVLKRTGQMTFESFCYGNRGDGNIFLRLFENPYPWQVEERLLQSNIMYTYADAVLDSFDFNHKNEPNLTYLNSYKLYNDEKYFKEFRKKYHLYYSRFIRLNSALQASIDDFYKEKLEGRFLISALVRCSAHALELLEDDKPSFETYERIVRDILKRQGIDIASDGWRLFIATDNELARKYFLSRYPQHVVTQDMKRLSEEQEEEYRQLHQKAGKHVSGYELQHRDANDNSRRSVERAQEILFDVHMLAKAQYFIFINSNISTMASYLNPDMTMIYCR